MKINAYIGEATEVSKISAGPVSLGTGHRPVLYRKRDARRKSC